MQNVERKREMFTHVHRVLRRADSSCSRVFIWVKRRGYIARGLPPIRRRSNSCLGGRHPTRAHRGGAKRVCVGGSYRGQLQFRACTLARSGGSNEPPVLWLGVIVPHDTLIKMRNSVRNNEEGRTVAGQSCYEKPL